MSWSWSGIISSMRILTIALVLCFGFSAHFATAQFDQFTSSFTNTEVGIHLMPPLPQPGQSVTATLSDYRSGSVGSSIEWSLNGEVLETSQNQREITFTAGADGQSQLLEVLATNNTGATELFQKVITPHYLDIIIEPQTRVPDFYHGRSLPSIGSLVNATALVSGEYLNAPDLVYTWRVGQEVIEGGPVSGRNKVTFTTPRGKNFTLSLQVAKRDGTIIANRSLAVPSVAPELVFYEVNTLHGMSKVAINNSLALIGNSVAVRAEPYYLDSRIYNNPMVAQWKVAGVTTETANNPYEATIERTGASGSRTSLQFHVRDTKQVLQGAQGTIQVSF